jgi:hypothetical protein
MPGSGGFSVTIAAVDAASAKIDAINKKIAAMRAPVERVQKAVAKFADVTGLSALGKGFGEIGRRSLDAFRSVSRIVEPLAAITSALSVAGMARLAFAWGEFGEKLSIASQRIGISTGRLQSLQGGARLAGASAEAMTSGLRTLGDTLTDAVAGRAPEAVVMMNTLGIAWRDATGHARSVTDVLPELRTGSRPSRTRPCRPASRLRCSARRASSFCRICDGDGRAWRNTPRKRGITA